MFGLGSYAMAALSDDEGESSPWAAAAAEEGVKGGGGGPTWVCITTSAATWVCSLLAPFMCLVDKASDPDVLSRRALDSIQAVIRTLQVSLRTSGPEAGWTGLKTIHDVVRRCPGAKDATVPITAAALVYLELHDPLSWVAKKPLDTETWLVKAELWDGAYVADAMYDISTVASHAFTWEAALHIARLLTRGSNFPPVCTHGARCVFYEVVEWCQRQGGSAPPQTAKDAVVSGVFVDRAALQALQRAVNKDALDGLSIAGLPTTPAPCPSFPAVPEDGLRYSWLVVCAAFALARVENVFACAGLGADWDQCIIFQ